MENFHNIIASISMLNILFIHKMFLFIYSIFFLLDIILSEKIANILFCFTVYEPYKNLAQIQFI
jgi:hypothetical protein